MTPIAQHLIDFIRPIGSISLAGGIWLADAITPEIPGVPSWVTALGLPVAFLIAVIYALISTNKALAASINGRLADRDAFAATLKDDAKSSEKTREQLIIATYEQTAAFKALAAELKARPCQKP